MDGTVMVLVGTTKGAFLLDGGKDRTGWHVRGPFCEGWPINHVVGDAESGTIWAGGGSEDLALIGSRRKLAGHAPYSRYH